MTVIVVLTAVVVLFSCKEFVLCLVIFSTTQKLDDNHRIVGMHSISIRTSADADNHKTKYPVYSTSSSTSNGNDFKIYSSFFTEAANQQCLAVDVLSQVHWNQRTMPPVNRSARWSRRHHAR